MRKRVADFIAEFLIKKNITDVFTVTGGGAMHLNDAFGKNKSLHCVYNHHEQACAIAAESYARLTERIAAVCVTSGPGGTNAITGVLGGWLDSIPMLVISGQVKFSTTIKCTDVPLRQLGDQEFNITDCVSTMTKYAYMVTEPNDILYHLERGLYLATHGRPGPVWLDIPLNIQGAMIETDELKQYSSVEDQSDVPGSLSSDVIDSLIQKLEKSKYPVVFAGDGIRRGKAYDEFLAVIDRLGVPVVTAWNAYDQIWDDHSLACGRPSTVGTRGGNFVVQNSDFLMVFGSRLTIRQISYNYEDFARNAYKVMVDIDEGELRKPTIKIDFPIHADIKDFFQRFLDSGYINKNEGHKQWLAWCRHVNAKYPVVLPEYYERQSPVNPYVFMKALSEQLNEGEVTVSSNGSACVCSFQAMSIKKNQRLYTNAGCAAMGYGLPAAMGAAVANRGARVICLEGDGSLQMNIQELQTIVYNRLNVKIFIVNNNGYHSIRQTQVNLFDSDFHGVSADSGVSFPSTEKIAGAYGIPYYRIDNLITMDAIIFEVLAHEGFAICEVVADPEQNFQPKTSSKRLPDGTVVSPPIEDMYPFLPREELAENYIVKG